jgi:hypothetical protein
MTKRRALTLMISLFISLSFSLLTLEVAIPRFTGLFVIGLLIGWFLYWSAPAKAYSDCASNTTGDVIALGKGGKTFWNLIQYRKKKNTDVYALLATSNFGLNPAAKFTVSSSAIAVLNCAALEGADAQAAALRLRLAKGIDVPIRNLTAAQVQTYYRKRLQNSTPDQNQLLSETERQLWADILAYAAKAEPAIGQSFGRLAKKLNLPPPSTGL